MFGGQLSNPNPVVYDVRMSDASTPRRSTQDGAPSDGQRVEPHEVFEFIRDIKDPEHPYTLEQLNVVRPDLIWVEDDGNSCLIRVEYTPTVPHCSLATLIGLCIRQKLSRTIDVPFKLDIYVTKGKHATEAEINKQVNDKERVAAALENPSLLPIVEQCIRENDY